MIRSQAGRDYLSHESKQKKELRSSISAATINREITPAETVTENRRMTVSVMAKADG